jgi:CheY-like chemotaxis protein
VRDSAETLLALVNDILDISKLEAGRVDLEAIDFSLAGMVESSVELLAPRAHRKKLELGIYVHPAARLDLRGDPTRLRQILQNLVGNAIKFTDRGSIEIDVRVHRQDDQRVKLRIAVTDTGIGVSPEARERLFQKFAQADSSITRRYGGTGLGLAICRQLVELIGGEIGVDSELGRGSTFWFTVPLQLAKQPVLDERAAVRSLAGLRALVVDDTEMNRRILRRQLEGLKLQVAEAIDGIDAIGALETAYSHGAPFDLVVLDHMMPGLSGPAVIDRLRENVSLGEPKIILASSMGSSDTAATDRQRCDAVLTKPVRLQTMTECLIRLFGERGASAAAGPDGDPASEAAAPRAASAAGPRILVAEDNQINLRLLLAILEREGFTVDSVENGVEAVAAVRLKRYDAVLMGRADAGDERCRGDRAHPRARRRARTRADHRPHRECDAGRARALPLRGHERVRLQADQPRRAGRGSAAPRGHSAGVQPAPAAAGRRDERCIGCGSGQPARGHHRATRLTSTTRSSRRCRRSCAAPISRA